MFERFERMESAEEHPVERRGEITGHGALPDKAGNRDHRKTDRAAYAS
jgi:hypothetical protein